MDIKPQIFVIMLVFLAIGVSYVCPRISAFFILGHSHPCELDLVFHRRSAVINWISPQVALQLIKLCRSYQTKVWNRGCYFWLSTLSFWWNWDGQKEGGGGGGECQTTIKYCHTKTKIFVNQIFNLFRAACLSSKYLHSESAIYTKWQISSGFGLLKIGIKQ